MRAPKTLMIQRVAAGYRSEFYCMLSNAIPMKLLTGRSIGPGDVIEAQLPDTLDHEQDVMYLFGKRLWIHTKILRVIRDYEPEVVIVSPTLRDLTNLILFIFRKHFSYKIIGWGMGEMPGRGKVRRKIHWRLQKFVTDRLDAMIVYSSEARDYYVKKLQFKKRISIAHNAVDISKFTQIKKDFKKEKDFTLVYVGRIIKEKKLEHVINVVKDRKDICLKIVGSGDHDYIEFLKSESGKYHERIEFVGPLFGKALNKFLVKCDLFILPSRGGLAINHAMASGLPVLVSVGDGTEKDLIIDRETGFIFEDCNFEMMAEYIYELRDNPVLLREVSIKATRHIHTAFTIDNMCHVFKKVVNESK